MKAESSTDSAELGRKNDDWFEGRLVHEAMALVEDKEAYQKAVQQCPEIIDAESPHELFLKACNGDMWNGARHLAAYWQMRLDVLGPTAAFLPLPKEIADLWKQKWTGCGSSDHGSKETGEEGDASPSSDIMPLKITTSSRTPTEASDDDSSRSEIFSDAQRLDIRCDPIEPLTIPHYTGTTADSDLLHGEAGWLDAKADAAFQAELVSPPLASLNDRRKLPWTARRRERSEQKKNELEEHLKTSVMSHSTVGGDVLIVPQEQSCSAIHLRRSKEGAFSANRKTFCDVEDGTENSDWWDTYEFEEESAALLVASSSGAVGRVATTEARDSFDTRDSLLVNHPNEESKSADEGLYKTVVEANGSGVVDASIVFSSSKETGQSQSQDKIPAHYISNLQQPSPARPLLQDDDPFKGSLVHEAMSFIPNNGAYMRAVQQCPEVIKLESPHKHYDSFFKGDVWAAAKRLAGYWNIRLEIFGDEAFIPLKESLCDECLAAVYYYHTAVLPPNTLGQPSFFIDRNFFDSPSMRRMTLDMRKRLIFVMMLLVSHATQEYNAPTGEFLAVCRADDLGTRRRRMDAEITRLTQRVVLEGMCCRLPAIHIVACADVVPASKAWPLWILAKLHATQWWNIARWTGTERHHARGEPFLHAGSKAEVEKSLIDCGFRSECLPTTVGGSWDTVTKWPEYVEQHTILKGRPRVLWPEHQAEIAASRGQQRGRRRTKSLETALGQRDGAGAEKITPALLPDAPVTSATEGDKDFKDYANYLLEQRLLKRRKNNRERERNRLWKAKEKAKAAK